MKELIERMAKALVDYPEQVRVSETQTGSTVVIKLDVAKEDVGKVIGKHGRNISAIRTLVFAINAKEGGKRARLDIIDD